MSNKRRARIREITEFNERRREAWAAKLASGLPNGSRILDAGAGRGPFRKYFSHCRYETQDFGSYAGTAGGIMQDKWSYTKLDYRCNITDIPVENATFDALLCTEVLEHLPEPILALREFSRILKPGGRLWLSAPLGSGLHQEPYHYYGGFTPHFYNRWLTEYGFKSIVIQNNCGFFMWQAQECSRMLGILLDQAGWKRWDPRRELSRLLLGRWLPIWLSRMEALIPVPQFTVGYFVEAVRESPGGGRNSTSPPSTV